MAGSNEARTQQSGDISQRISTHHLAALVVDALIDAGIVKKDDMERAIRIAAEEIEVRKALGDY